MWHGQTQGFARTAGMDAGASFNTGAGEASARLRPLASGVQDASGVEDSSGVSASTGAGAAVVVVAGGGSHPVWVRM